MATPPPRRSRSRFRTKLDFLCNMKAMQKMTRNVRMLKCNHGKSALVTGAVYRLEGDPGLRAAVTYSGVGQSSVSSVRPPSRLGSTILVYPR